MPTMQPRTATSRPRQSMHVSADWTPPSRRRISRELGHERAGSRQPASVDDAARSDLSLMQHECFPVAGAGAQRAEKRKGGKGSKGMGQGRGSRAKGPIPKGKNGKGKGRSQPWAMNCGSMDVTDPVTIMGKVVKGAGSCLSAIGIKSQQAAIPSTTQQVMAAGSRPTKLNDRQLRARLWGARKRAYEAQKTLLARLWRATIG